MTDLSPMPTPWKRGDNPEVTIWMKREYPRTMSDAPKGESSGDSSDAARTKPKVGRPSKKDQLEANHTHVYLQGRDGVPVSAEMLGKLSLKARSVWDFLLSKKLAPTTFSKMSWNAWDLYARAMLTDPEFDFLLLCDDAQWKLREWSTQNYSGWAGNRGLRPKNTGQKAGKIRDVLDDPALIRVKSSNGMDDYNDCMEPAESGDDGSEETTPETDDAGTPEADVVSRENPSPSTQLVHSILAVLSDTNTRSKPREPVISEENPGPSTQLVCSILAIVIDANTRFKPQGPIKSAIVNPL